jgi:hypothetical protein
MALNKTEIHSALNELENYFSEQANLSESHALHAFYTLENELEGTPQPGDKGLEKEVARTGREKEMQEARIVLDVIRGAMESGNHATGLQACRDLRSVVLQIWPNSFSAPA